MKKLALIAAAVAAIGSAHAATVTYSFSNPDEPTDITQTGNLGLFNSALGTLSAIGLTLSGDVSATLSFTNSGARAKQFSWTTDTEFSWESSLGGLNAYLAGTVLSLQLTTGNQTVAPGGTASFGPLTNSGSMFVSLPTSLFAELTRAGGGSFGLTCNSSTMSTLTGFGGNLLGSQSTVGGCGASIEYSYRPTANVPEPATYAMWALAMGLAGALRLRRKA